MERAIERPDVIKDYQRRRKLMLRLHDRLLARVTRDVLDEAVARLDIPVEDDRVVFGSQHEMAVASDFALYDVRRDRMNAPQRLLAEDPPRDPEERAVLEAMARARFGI